MGTARSLGDGAKWPRPGHGDRRPTLALALLYERRHECPGEDSRRAGADAQQVAAWLEKAMVDGMDEVINPRLDANYPNWPSHSAVCAVCFYSREEVTLG